MPVTPTGNTSTLLNDFGALSDSSFNEISDLFGAVADVSGFIGAAVAIVGFVEAAFGAASETQTALTAVLNALQRDFHLLNGDLSLQQLSTRNTLLNNALAIPLARLKLLQTTVTANPPFSAEYRNQQITDCLAAVEALTGINAPNQIWNLNFDWQVYFQDNGAQQTIKWELKTSVDQNGKPGSIYWAPTAFDVGYGRKPAPENADGSAFVYRGPLQTYMLAVAIYIAVGQALDPNFRTSNQAELNTCLATLEQIHDLVTYKGIQILFPAPWPDGHWLLALSREGTMGIKDLDQTKPDYPWVDHGAPSEYDGCFLYFGAVEVYSGVNALAPNYKVYFDLTPNANKAANNRTGSFNKAKLKARALAKQVYHKAGMPAVANAIDAIKRVRDGQAPRTARFGDWSFRQDILGAMQTPIIGNHFSMRTVASSLRSYPPADPAGQLSFRQLLSVP